MREITPKRGMSEDDANPVSFSLSHWAVVFEFSVFWRSTTVNGDAVVQQRHSFHCKPSPGLDDFMMCAYM